MSVFQKAFDAASFHANISSLVELLDGQLYDQISSTKTEATVSQNGDKQDDPGKKRVQLMRGHRSCFHYARGAYSFHKCNASLKLIDRNLDLSPQHGCRSTGQG